MNQRIWSKLLFIVATGFAATLASAQDFTPTYKYRISLSDKKDCGFSVKHPEAFLSPKAIERRKRQKLKVNETDLPVTPKYVEQIRAIGVGICSTSKWNNTVVVVTADTTLIDQIEALPFVTATRRVAAYTKPEVRDTTDRFALIKPEPQKVVNPDAGIMEKKDDDTFKVGKVLKVSSRTRYHVNESDNSVDFITEADTVEAWGKDREELEKLVAQVNEAMKAESPDADDDDTPESPYGAGFNQINMLGGIQLHERGFRGQGMTIAIIDGGFYNADIVPGLSHVKILGTKDFVTPGGNVYENDRHGMMVLSCIAANTPGKFIGTAPEASFYLLRSEDGGSEQLVEEDNWCAAIEYADSLGVDVVNTSLGYTKFDNRADNVRYREQDGHTHIISNSASMAASKGMVLCQSAGNEGDSAWKRIGVPADAENILTVGALRPDGVNTNFSSLGHSADGRIKPDICAQGQQCAVYSTRGTLTTANGTSFSSPISCGMVACFWQAHPDMTAFDVMDAIRARADRYDNPDNVFGYGVPNYNAE